MREIVVDSSNKLGVILDTLQKQKENIRLDIRKAIHTTNIISVCDKCKEGNLIIRRGKSGKRFVGCSNYPKCNNSYPLPQKGNITTTDEVCVECNAPVIKVRNARFEYKMCLNMVCKTKESWKNFKKDSGEKKSKK